MPNKEFLEEYPLYRKFNAELPSTMDRLPKVRIKMGCTTCKSEQTFAMINEYWEIHGYGNPPSEGTVRAVYICTHCEKFERVFAIALDKNRKWLMKFGQYPAWETTGNSHIEELLGKHADYFKKGLICESQGYGIGAHGYYRRIVEETIDELLSQISSLLAGDELAKYSDALEKTKKQL